MRKLSDLVVLIKGGGEVASGVSHKLHRSHFKVCLTEIPGALAVCRGTAFSDAIFDDTKEIEGVTAELVPTTLNAVRKAWQRGHIALVLDPEASIKEVLKPDVLIDGRMMKKPADTKITDAPLVIGLGPGFTAGKDVHIIVETWQGDNLGRLITQGKAIANTGDPLYIGGLSKERVVWAPEAGVFNTDFDIGQKVTAGQEVGRIGKISLVAPMAGILRGLIRDGVKVRRGDKLIEVDPVNDSSICFIIRDKMRTIAGGVLEAILMKYNIPAKPNTGAK